MSAESRVWLEINLKTLKENFNKIQAVVEPLHVVAVLKANAYGLGVKPIAETLIKAGAYGFGVAELNEALSLADTGKPVQMLSGVLPSEIPDAVNAGIILPIIDKEIAELISRESVRQGKVTECQFKIDTGMGRVGILAKDAIETISEIVKLPGLDCSGIYSHFPVAYKTGSEYTYGQIEKFYDVLDGLKARGITFRKVHMANSDAINNFSTTYARPFTHVRTGINLHGSFDNEGQRNLKLESVLTLKTRVVGIRTLPAGTNIGYGCTYTLLKDTRVAAISAGYADGLPLALSNRGYVLINGYFCPVLGRISMDYTTVSLEDVPESAVKRGDEVICLGGEGLKSISVETWAQLKGTHAYEIICSFGTRVARKYLPAD